MYIQILQEIYYSLKVDDYFLLDFYLIYSNHIIFFELLSCLDD